MFRPKWDNVSSCIQFYLSIPEEEWIEPTTSAMKLARDIVYEALHMEDAPALKHKIRKDLIERVEGKPVQAVTLDGDVDLKLVKLDV